MYKTVNSEIDKFFSHYRLRHYHKGQVLILNGEGGDHIYKLNKGRVKVYDITYRGEEMILNYFMPPAFFPMSLAINRVENNYIYEAETDIEVFQAPALDMIKFIKKNPDIMYDLLSRVYIGIDGMLGRMAQLMSGTARTRLIYEILVSSRRFGIKQKDREYIIEVSERDLGARAGLTRETVSREMSKLIAEELLSTRPGRIRVYDIEKLEKQLSK